VIVTRYSIKNYGFIGEGKVIKKCKLLFENKIVLLNKTFRQNALSMGRALKHGIYFLEQQKNRDAQ
jgi:hypothetical protein